MLLIVIRDGGTLCIGDKQIKAWEHLYPYVDVKKEIEKLDSMGLLRRFTANGLLKYINRHLGEVNRKKEV